METIELAYDVYEHGTDPAKIPIIFLHGAFWNKYMLTDLAVSMSQSTKRKIYCLDLRCHNESEFREDWNSEIMAEDIKGFMNDRKLEKVSFVCHSFSSTLAYLVTLDVPQKVEKIVMVDHTPFMGYTDELFQTNIVKPVSFQNRFLQLLDPSLSLSEAKMKILSFKNGGVTEGQKIFIKKCAYELIKEDNKFKWKTNHKALLDGYIKNFLTKPRGRSDHEILIIRCKDSAPVTDEKFQVVLKDNPNAKLVTVDDATHLLLFEKKEEFIKIVTEFLS